MKKITKTLMLSVIMMTLAMVSMLIGGCSKSPLESVTIDQPAPPQLLQRSPAAVSGAQLAGPNLYYEEIVPSLTGATMILYDVILIVPPLAVDNDTLYSISIPDADLFYNEFGTRGLQFNVPVTVIMCYRDADLSGIDESTIRLAWFDEYYQSWRNMPCMVDTASKTVTGQLSHFSSYGLISD